MTMGEAIDVMSGSLDDHDLVHVLQVVSIGRQYVGVEVTDRHGARGTIFTKAGEVVRVDAAGQHGVDAFFHLLGTPQSSFRVFRLPTPESFPPSIGPLSALLERRRKLDTAPPAPAPVPAPTASGTSAIASPRPLSSPPPMAAPPPIAAAPPTPAQPAAAQPAPAQPAPAQPAPAQPAPAQPAPAQPAAAQPAAAQPAPAQPAPAQPAVAATQTAAPQTPTQLSPAQPRATPPPVVAIASPKGGVGKTTIALNVAVSLARRGHRVTLVDADINGDVFSWLDARDKVERGAYDVLLSGANPADCLVPTTHPSLVLLPARGPSLPTVEALMADLTPAWQRLLGQIDADVVLVDTPAGLYGPSASILKAATHVVGVLQAESVAARSFDIFREFIALLPDADRPTIAGVVLNMLQSNEAASVEVLTGGFSDGAMFDLTLPRNPVFLQASHEGVPLGMLDEHRPPAAAWLFDGLAAELAQRLELTPPEARTPRRLLL